MIQINETKISNITKNKYQDLKISFIIKKEDYTSEIEKEIYELCRDGNLGAFVFQETEYTEDTGKSENDIKNKLLQDLAFYMQKYAEKEGTDIDIITQTLYEGYGIVSRKDLTIEQLKREIESYKAGLLYD